MKLKKPAKDHRGSWDLVLDNEGITVASLRVVYKPRDWPAWVNSAVQILWPTPTCFTRHFRRHTVYGGSAVAFFKMLGVDTAPLEKLQAEKLMEEKGE